MASTLLTSVSMAASPLSDSASGNRRRSQACRCRTASGYTYDINYYGAFVLDPDGNKIEAVTYSAK